MTVQAPSGPDARQRRARIAIIGLVCAEASSTIGGRMALFGIPWLVLITTGSPIKVGLVTAAETLPYVLSGVLAAPLQDRMGARRTSILADAASAVAMAAIIIGYQVSFSVLLVLVAIAGGLRAQADRSKNNLFKPLVEAAGTHFGRFASAREGALRTSNLVGAGVAGVAIAVVGSIGALWINTATFILSMLLVLTIVRDATQLPPSESGEKPPPPPPVEPYFQALRNGFGSFRGDRLIRSVTGMLLFTNLFNQASAVVFVPLWVLTGDHSPAVLGFVAGSFAIGALVGTAIFTFLAPYLPPYSVLVVGYFVGGAPRFLILALTDDMAVVVAVMFISGIAMCSVNPTIGAMVFQRVSGVMLARVGGIMAAVAYAGIPIGGLVGGTLVERIGYTNAVLIASTVYFAVTLTPVVRHRVWRELNDTAKSPKPTGEEASLPPFYALGSSALGPRVSLRYTEDGWTVSARRGLRTLVPRRSIPPAEALSALNRLDCPPVHDTVRDALSGVRARAEIEARQLRGEVSRLETTLTGLTFR